MRNYVLSHNPSSLRVLPGQLLQYIQDSRSISGWFSPFPGTYILKSTEELATLQRQFSGFFAGEHFLITHAEVMAGVLTQPLWDWVNKDAFDSLLSEPVTVNALTSWLKPLKG